MKTVESIDAYIAGFPEDIQAPLKQMRQAIQQAAPDATEAIKYGMPTFVLQGNLVHFAANKHHIGFYLFSLLQYPIWILKYLIQSKHFPFNWIFDFLQKIATVGNPVYIIFEQEIFTVEFWRNSKV